MTDFKEFTNMRETVSLFGVDLFSFNEYDLYDEYTLYYGVEFLLPSLKKYEQYYLSVDQFYNFEILEEEGKEVTSFSLIDNEDFKERLQQKHFQEEIFVSLEPEEDNDKYDTFNFCIHDLTHGKIDITKEDLTYKIFPMFVASIVNITSEWRWWDTELREVVYAWAEKNLNEIISVISKEQREG